MINNDLEVLRNQHGQRIKSMANHLRTFAVMHVNGNTEEGRKLLEAYMEVTDTLIYSCRDLAYVDAVEIADAIFQDDFPKPDENGNVVINKEKFLKLMMDSFIQIQIESEK